MKLLEREAQKLFEHSLSCRSILKLEADEREHFFGGEDEKKLERKSK
jgi:hypothetical protein